MKILEKAEDKIEKICSILRNEAIEPAKEEAAEIVRLAKESAAAIIAEAKLEAEKLVKKASMQNENEKQLLNSSLVLASDQAVEKIRQDIEKIFNNQLQKAIDESMEDPKIIAKIIDVLIHAIEREGMQTNLEAAISQNISAEEVCKWLTSSTKELLKNKPINIGNFCGGAQVMVKEKNMRIELTATDVKELIAAFIRKPFRNLLFGNEREFA